MIEMKTTKLMYVSRPDLRVYVTKDANGWYTAWAKNWDDATLDLALLQRQSAEVALKDGHEYYDAKYPEIWEQFSSLGEDQVTSHLEK